MICFVTFFLSLCLYLCVSGAEGGSKERQVERELNGTWPIPWLVSFGFGDDDYVDDYVNVCR